MKPLSLLLSVMLFLFFAVPISYSQTCPASAGCLDPTFAGTGLARVANAGGTFIESIAMTSDGSLIAMPPGNGEPGHHVTKLKPDGSLADFGSGGTANFNWKLVQGRNIYYGTAHSVAVQIVGGNERILVAGVAPMLVGKKVSSRLRIDRLMPDGSYDTSWGNNGVLQLDLEGASAIVVQPIDQKIVITASTSNQVIRLTAAGSLDPSFGSGGIRNIPAAFHVSLDASGRILAAGTINTGIRQVQIRPAVTRLNSDGSIDTSFGSNGTALAGFISRASPYLSVSPDAFGNVILGTNTGATDATTDFAVERFDSLGKPDTSFNGNGIAIVDFGGRDIGMAAAAQSDGSIVVVGNTFQSGGPAGSDLAFARLTFGGML